MAKEDTIIEAATHLFLHNGFGGTSMEAVAREAGTAKQTLYNYFRNKEALFQAIVRRRCAAIFSELPASSGDQKDIESYLKKLGRRFMDMMFMDETLELYRLVISETPRFPELGRVYYESGPKVAVKTLSDFLTGHGVEENKSFIMAREFFGMLTGYLLTKALLDKNYKPSKAEKDKTVASAATLFADFAVKNSL